MDMFLVMFAAVVVLIVVASYFISAEVYAVLLRKGSASPKAKRVLTFIGSFLLLFVLIAYLFISNLRIER